MSPRWTLAALKQQASLTARGTTERRLQKHVVSIIDHNSMTVIVCFKGREASTRESVTVALPPVLTSDGSVDEGWHAKAIDACFAKDPGLLTRAKNPAPPLGHRCNTANGFPLHAINKIGGLIGPICQPGELASLRHAAQERYLRAHADAAPDAASASTG